MKVNESAAAPTGEATSPKTLVDVGSEEEFGEVFRRAVGEEEFAGDEHRRDLHDGEFQRGRREVESRADAREGSAQPTNASARATAPKLVAPTPELGQISREILQALRRGEDAQQRRVVFLEVRVPGLGDLRVRLRREGDSVSVRLRADNDGLARAVRAELPQLREAGAARGILFAHLEVLR